MSCCNHLERQQAYAQTLPSPSYSQYAVRRLIFRGSWVSALPCKYLGLTLKIGRLQRVDEQALIDRVAGKLRAWKGKLLNKASRLALINSVLSSVILYHMTVFSLSKWAMRSIDKIRRQFLWRGAEEQRYGHYLVNWKRAQRQKN
jgi:hypothetical protein